MLQLIRREAGLSGEAGDEFGKAVFYQRFGGVFRLLAAYMLNIEPFLGYAPPQGDPDNGEQANADNEGYYEGGTLAQFAGPQT